jgi:hypothetical protein
MYMPQSCSLFPKLRAFDSKKIKKLTWFEELVLFGVTLIATMCSKQGLILLTCVLVAIISFGVYHPDVHWKIKRVSAFPFSSLTVSSSSLGAPFSAHLWPVARLFSLGAAGANHSPRGTV